MRITENAVVSLRFKMMNSRGEVLEDILEGPAVQYLQGSGTILPALETELEGLSRGAHKTILISKEQVYEEIDDSFRIDVIVDDVRMATAKEITGGFFYPKPDASRGEYCAPGCIC